MDIKLQFTSEDLQFKPRVFLIKNTGMLIWLLQWLWFDFEVVKNTKKIKICPTCKSKGFEVSKLGKNRCTFSEGAFED